MATKKYGKYSQESLKNAIEAIKNGMPCATASKIYKIPRITLFYKSTGKYPVQCKSGVSTVLSKEEEGHLSKWIVDLSTTGFPVTKEQLLDSVALLIKKLKRPNNFKNGRPGRHWYEGFMTRHPEISIRMSQNLTSSRAKVTEASIRNWFSEIDNYFKLNNISFQDDPRRVFNADETAFFLSPKGKSVLAKKGTKAVYNYANSDEKECLTTLITGNACGQLAPPMVIFAYERIPKHIILQMPEGWGIGKSESGWMTGESSMNMFQIYFFPGY